MRSTRSRPLVALLFAGGVFCTAATGCSEDAGSTGQGGSGTASAASGAGGAGATSAATGASGGSTAVSTTSSGQGGSGGAQPSCPDVTHCDAPHPDLGAARDWVHFTNGVTAAAGFANHRGRDMFYNPGDTVWVFAKFAYGLLDDDIQDDDVDVYLNRGCGPDWEALGTVRTTDDGAHATVEGVDDTGGWVYFDATSLGLGEGRHRFLFVLGGDLSLTETYVDIVAPGTPLVVTDVDGTLTTEEAEEFTALLTGSLPDANPDAAEALTTLADKGYRVFYLTARPELLGARTREFLALHGFPLGLVHTTLTFTGATGASAVTFKTQELADLAARGLVPSWAFGNTDSDAEAFFNAGISPAEQRVMFQFDDPTYGSRRIESYTELLPELAALPDAVCP